MATFRLHRFANPNILKGIEPARLLRFFEPFREHVESRGFDFPEDDSDDVDYEKLAEILAYPNDETPPRLVDALHRVDEMSTAAASRRSSMMRDGGRSSSSRQASRTRRTRMWPSRRGSRRRASSSGSTSGTSSAQALVDQGRKREALEYAEASRDDLSMYEQGIDAVCEEILLSCGLADEAYRRYAFQANAKGTRVATLRAIAAKYPSKSPETILREPVAASSGEEGKWFAAAKELGLFDLAIELATRSPADPKTLNRAARDHLAERPAFALEAALLPIRWITEGYGYELTSADVLDAVDFALKAGEALGGVDQVRRRIQQLVPANAMRHPFVGTTILRRLER